MLGAAVVLIALGTITFLGPRIEKRWIRKANEQMRRGWERRHPDEHFDEDWL
jgi:hypothetical protein